MPTSPVMVSAISWLRAPSSSASACSTFWRSAGAVWPHVSKAVLAAATALSTSSGVPSGMWPMTCSVEALMTSMVPLPVDGTQAPSM